MGRAKLKLELIPKEKSRKSTYIKRKNGLKKKIYEFSTLCGVDACMIIYGNKQGDRPIKPEIWPNNVDEIHRIINRFNQVDRDDRGKRSVHVSDFFEDRKNKVENELIQLRRKNESSLWDDRIDDFTVDQLRQLTGALRSKMEVMDERIALMKDQDGLSNGAQEMVQYSNATENQNPCYLSNDIGPIGNNLHGTTWRGDDIMHTQPLRYAAPSDHNRLMDNDNTHMMLSMTGTNGYDYGYFNTGGPIGNFSHPTVKNPPFVYDPMVMPSVEGMEFMNRGSSTFGRQPMPMMMPSSSSIMQPCFIPMGSSSQMHHQASIMQTQYQMYVGPSSSSQMQNQPFNGSVDRCSRFYDQ